MTKAEFVGLTKDDIDFEAGTIRVDHQLQRRRDMEYIIEDTKTVNGTRVIPMTDDVRECFERIISQRKKPETEPAIGGRKGFLYLDKNGMPYVALHWEKYFQHITTKYNKIYKEELPKVTPHVCRHTYCSFFMLSKYAIIDDKKGALHGRYKCTVASGIHRGDES